MQPITVQASEIAPWFDQPGGGIQYQFETSISDLLDAVLYKG